MKLTLSLLPLAVSAAVLEERQAGKAAKGKTAAPAAKGLFVGFDELKPQINPKARRTITKMGPYTIPVGRTGGGVPFFGSVTQGLCNNNGKDPRQDCTVLGGRVGVMWADGPNKGKIGDPSNGIYIHHILSSDTKKRETPWFSACNSPNRQSGNVNGITGGAGFLSTGEDSAADQAMWTDAKNVWNTGYHIKSTDTFNYWAQLVNYNKEPAKVYVTFDTEWVPGLVGQDTKTIVVSATCGAGMIKMSNAGATNTTSGKFYIMEDGRIMGARGHIHDGGVAMHMLINGKDTCSSKAVYGTRSEGMAGMSHGHKMKREAVPHQGAGGMGDYGNTLSRRDGGDGLLTVASMSDCDGPYKVKKGDYVVLKAEYDLKKHPLRVSATGAKQADVMGMMGILFSPGVAPIKLNNGTILN